MSKINIFNFQILFSKYIIDGMFENIEDNPSEHMITIHLLRIYILIFMSIEDQWNFIIDIVNY